MGTAKCVCWSVRLTTTGILVATLFPARASGECPSTSSFVGLGDLQGGAVASYASAFSGDGSVVVGISESTSGPQAFRWTTGTGLAALGDLSGGAFFSEAYRVSRDGTTVVGISMSAASGSNPEAMYWTSATGIVGLGDVPGGDFWSRANAVSDDKSVIAGDTHTGPLRMSFWRASTQQWEIIDTEPGYSSSVHDLSGNAQWAVGWRSIGGSTSAMRWSSGTGFQSLGVLSGHAVAVAEAVSSDGSIVAGYSGVDGDREAFRWVPSGGMASLGDLSGGLLESVARGMSDDGFLLVGFGTSTIGREAVLWDQTLTMRRIADVLANAGVHVPNGWILREAADITSACGKLVVVGWGINPNGDPEGWVASFDPNVSVPATSTWGLVVMAIVLATAGTLLTRPYRLLGTGQLIRREV